MNDTSHRQKVDQPMDYRQYRSRREGAGPERFVLVKYWERNRMKVRELGKVPSAKKPIEESHYLVRDVDPTAQGKTAGAEAEEVEWEWDDKLGRHPISRSRARLQNEKEMVRANLLLGDRRMEKTEVPNDASVGNKLDSDIHFLRRVKGEFWQWFYEAGFDSPINEDSDRPNQRGFDFAEALYAYLDLDRNEAEDVGHSNFKLLAEDAGEEKQDLAWSYGHIITELREAGFYPSDDHFEDQTNRQKLLELCRRMKSYKEDGEIPTPK